MSTIDTGLTTKPGPATPITNRNIYSDGFSFGIYLNNDSYVPSNPSLYKGTLSAHGNLVAMQINPGAFNYKVDPSGARDENGNPICTIGPFLTGFIREYWRHPSTTTLGNDSAIPALTGVMPARFTRTPGNALYYIDLQMTRLAGSNFFNNYYFISAFSQILAWVVSSNEYLIAIKNLENKNLEYFGYKSYQELITQGFSRYLTGETLRAALLNMGTMVKQINTGQFGTANSVAKHLLDVGLGAIGDLAIKLRTAGVNFQEIYKEEYTLVITSILNTITNNNDLAVIQGVLKSSIPNISSPMDYTDILKSSGSNNNDSIFQSLKEFGKNLYNKSPNLSVETGKELVDRIDLIINEAYASVETLANNDSLLPQNIVDSIKQTLPESPNGGRINILNVIGCGTGYLIDQLNAVNRGIDQLSKTGYGQLLHNSLNAISQAYRAYRDYSYNINNIDTTGAIIFVEPPIQYKIACDSSVQNYKNLVQQIANDPAVNTIVQSINANWDQLCESISYEVINYSKANITVTETTDNSTITNFVASLPSYANDSNSQGLDYFLYGLAQPNRAGDILKSILNQFKNVNNVVQIGARPNGLL